MAGYITDEFLVAVLKRFQDFYFSSFIQEAVDASANTKGGVKVGEGLGMDGAAIKVKAGDGLGFNSEDGALKVTLTGGGSGSYTLPVASENNLGGIRPGTGVLMRNSYLDVKPATTNDLGGIKVGEGLSIDDDKRLSVIKGADIPLATKTTIGGIKIGGGLEIIDGFLNVVIEGGSLEGGGGTIYTGDGLEKNGAYISVKPATTGNIGGIKVGKGLEIDNYSKLHVTAATPEQIGGIIPGAGLEMDGDVLNVTTSTGSNEVFNEFTGATTNTNGKKGLVPAPTHGDQGKFLCGNGTWVAINQSSTSIPQTATDVEGALWQDVIDGVPCLKFRHGLYEYNFFGDGKLIEPGMDYPPLDSSGLERPIYKLNQGVSTQNGGIWYELKDDVPSIKLRQDSYEFSFKYNSVTYKGSQTNGLISYVPCESYDTVSNTFADWGADFANTSLATLNVTSNMTVVDATYSPLYRLENGFVTYPLMGRCFTPKEGAFAQIKLYYDKKYLPPLVNADTSYTTDCWFFFNDKLIDKAINAKETKTVIPPVYITSNGGLRLSILRSTNNVATKVSNITYSAQHIINDARKYANRRHHLAITCFLKESRAFSRLALDGEFLIEYPTNASIFSVANEYTTINEHAAFNKIRWFNKVFWKDERFTLPTENDYRR